MRSCLYHTKVQVSLTKLPKILDFSSVSISNLMLSIKQSGSLDELDKELLFNHAQRMAHRLKRHF